MKIGALVHMYPYHHCAGAEMMLHSMLLEAVRHGHEAVVVIEGFNREKPDIEPYEIDGVKVSNDRRALNHIDILLTHLDRTPEAEELAAKRGIPLAQVFHNHGRPGTAVKCDLAIYNTDWIREGYPTNGNPAAITVHPPVWSDRYRVERTGEHITLINLQRAKGVEMFYTLAAQMPHLKFLGVKGSYGVQEPAPTLPNLTIWENQPDVRTVYAETKILLMPSAYESYGRVAVEAAVSGIPTLANRTEGLWEALGGCGSFPLPDSDSWKAGINFILDTYEWRSKDALRLAKSLDPEGEMADCLEALEAAVARYKKL